MADYLDGPPYPQAITTMSDLTDISQQLQSTTIDALSESSTISFKGRQLKLDSEDDAKEIVDALSNAENLVTLCLTGNTIGSKAAVVIGEALKKHPEFKRALWSDIFTGRLKDELPIALKTLSNGILQSGAQLTELDLSDNAFGPSGLPGITEFLKSSSCFSLKILRLNNNGLGQFGAKILTDALLVCHSNSVEAKAPLKLETLICGRNRLENPGATYMAAVFKAIGTLQTVALPQNGIQHAGIAALAEAFGHNDQLRNLDLSDNIFTEKGALAIARVLPKLTNLETVNFSDCLTRTGGAIDIANALSDGHDSLYDIQLSYNEIKASAAVGIAKALATKPNLKQLGLNGNQFGESGINQLLAFLDDNNAAAKLGSLSDDEGENSSDEEEEEEEEEDVQNGEVKGKADSSEAECIDENDDEKENECAYSAAEVLAKPTLTEHDVRMIKAPKQFAVDLIECLGSDKADISEHVSAVVRLASVVSSANESALADGVSEIADVVFEYLVKRPDFLEGYMANALLVEAGLIKCEDRRKVRKNVYGSRLLLNRCLDASYLTKSMKTILKTFLEKQ